MSFEKIADGIENEVVLLLKSSNKTIATAESCTGGMLSAAITSVSGASDVFGFGVCTYANEAKIRLLGVDEKTLSRVGAVSAEIAAQMATGIKRLSGADIGVGITGIAGPLGGTKQKPVGLVYIGVCGEKTYVYDLLYENANRHDVRKAAVSHALELVRRLVLKQDMPQGAREVL